MGEAKCICKKGYIGKSCDRFPTKSPTVPPTKSPTVPVAPAQSSKKSEGNGVAVALGVTIPLIVVGMLAFWYFKRRGSSEFSGSSTRFENNSVYEANLREDV